MIYSGSSRAELHNTMNYSYSHARKRKTNFSEIYLLMLNNTFIHLPICYHYLFLRHKARRTDGRTGRYCKLYGYIQYSLFTSWPPRVSVQWLAYLIPGLNLHLKGPAAQNAVCRSGLRSLSGGMLHSKQTLLTIIF